MKLNRRQFTALAGGAAIGAFGLAQASFGQSRGGTVIAAMNTEPTHLNPGLGTSNTIQTAGGKIFQGLFNLNGKREIVPALAEAVDVSEDGLEFTFRLRQDVRWHDGQPFTADDVLFSLEVVPQFNSRTANALSRVAETTRVDDYTVILRLQEPYLPFVLAISGVNLVMIPKHVYEGTDYLTNPANSAPVGTGPFRLQEWRRGEYIHLVRNEDYYDADLPYLDEIYFLVIPDASQRSIAVETGQTNVIIAFSINEQDQQRFLETGQYRVIEGAYDGVGATLKINVNKRRPHLGDKRFRQALMHAIDRQQIVDNVYFGAAKAMDGPIASATAYYDRAALKLYDYDPDKANALLDEMGLTRGQGGMRHSFKLTVQQGNASAMRIQELIRLHLAEVGLDAQLDAVDTITPRDAAWDYDLLMLAPGQFLDPDIGVSRFLLSSSITNAYQANTGGYSNARVDELWALAVSAGTVEEAQGYYSEIQSIVTEDVPDIWIAETDQRLIARVDIDGFSDGPQEGYAEWDGVYFT